MGWGGRRRVPPWLALALLLAALGGCRDDAPRSAATAPAGTASDRPTGTPTAPPQVAANHGVALVEVASGAQHWLDGPNDDRTVGAGATFVRGEARIWLQRQQSGDYRTTSWFDLEGRELERRDGYVPSDPRLARCEQIEQGRAALIDGGRVPFACGDFSPDGTRMRVSRIAFKDGAPERYEVGVLRLDTLEARFFAPDLAFGIGDSFSGSSWSPSSRYVVEHELAGAAGVWLLDTATGASTLLARDGPYNRLGYGTVWLPSEDRLLVPDGRGTALLDVATGERRSFAEVPWPARAVGGYVYGPTAGPDPSAPPWVRIAETVVARIAGGVVVARWPGGFESTSPADRETAIVATGDGVRALLNAPGCNGVQFFAIDGAADRCLPARIASLSPDGTRIAYATGSGGRYGVGMPRAERVLLLDLRTGRERLLVDDIRDYVPPMLQWNAAGTHLLVAWTRPQWP